MRPCVELPVGLGDRLARLAEIGDVVQRVLEAEDVDPALGRARHETPGEVAADRVRADEEPAAERHAERRLRPSLQRADPLPRALDAAPYGRVEDTSAGDFEIREAGAVENLGEAEEVRRRHPVGKRLLAQQPDRRIDERGHGERVTPSLEASWLGRVRRCEPGERGRQSATCHADRLSRVRRRHLCGCARTRDRWRGRGNREVPPGRSVQAREM